MVDGEMNSTLAGYETNKLSLFTLVSFYFLKMYQRTKFNSRQWIMLSQRSKNAT